MLDVGIRGGGGTERRFQVGETRCSLRLKLGYWNLYGNYRYIYILFYCCGTSAF